MSDITSTYCMIPNCPSKNSAKGSSPTLSSFPIPPNGSLRDIWIAQIVKHLPSNFCAMETGALNLEVCSLHFRPEELSYSVTADLDLNQHLRPGAVPTLFPVSSDGNQISPSIPSSPTVQQSSSKEGVHMGTVEGLELLNPNPISVALSTATTGIQNGGHSKFPCSFCPYLSSSMQNLRRHQQHHTVQSAFQCPSCTFSVGFQTSLNHHLKRVHGIIPSKSIEKKPVHYPSEQPQFKNTHPENYFKSSMIKTSLPKETISHEEQSRKEKKLAPHDGIAPSNNVPTDDSRNFWDVSDALLDEALARKLRAEAELHNLQRETRELWMWINADSGDEPPGKRPEIFLTGMVQRFQQAEAELVFIQLEEGALRRERENYLLLSQPAL